MVYFLCKAYDSDRQNCYFAQSLPVRGAWIEIPDKQRGWRISPSLPVRGAWIEIKRQRKRESSTKSLPVRGAWIEIIKTAYACRVRWSLPVRGAWIEIPLAFGGVTRCRGRSPCGERGLKCTPEQTVTFRGRRSPCGERGLKSSGHFLNGFIGNVAPRAGGVD